MYLNLYMYVTVDLLPKHIHDDLKIKDTFQES